MQKTAPVIAINFADIVEENGKTIRDNNLAVVHDIPIGALVEVKFEEWHGDGCCEKIHARLWVVRQDRDCDGTPLYSLSKHKEAMFVDGALRCRGEDGWWFRQEIVLNIANDIHTGFSKESLKIIEVTPELIHGEGALEWRSDEN